MSDTLTSYRYATAKLLGPFLNSNATGGSSTTLVCTTWPFMSTLAQNDLYTDYYLMRPAQIVPSSGDVARIVATYTASSGTYQVDQSYSAVPTNGEAFELHGHPIEPYTAMTALLNDALKRCMVNVEVSFTPTSGDSRQELTGSFPWLLDPRWVYQAGWLGSTEQRRQVDPFIVHPLRGVVYSHGPYIYFDWKPWSFAGTELVYLRCIRRAYNLILGANNQTVGSVTVATNATPIQITVANHGLASNALVTIAGVGGNTNANGNWQITVVDTSNFTLNGSGGNANYTSGGTVTSDFGRDNGLSLEADTCPIATEWLAASAAVLAWDRYGHLLEQTANQKLIRDATKAAAWFNEITEWNFQEPLRTLQPVHAFGPPRYGGGLGW